MYQRILLRCECGREPAGVRELGLTPDRELVVHWRCPQCRKRVYVIRALADYWRECPSSHLAPVRKPSYASADLIFLRSVGIRLPDDSDE